VCAEILDKKPCAHAGVSLALRLPYLLLLPDIQLCLTRISTSLQPALWLRKRSYGGEMNFPYWGRGLTWDRIRNVNCFVWKAFHLVSPVIGLVRFRWHSSSFRPNADQILSVCLFLNFLFSFLTRYLTFSPRRYRSDNFFFFSDPCIVGARKY
jgi:hypothetical protein